MKSVNNDNSRESIKFIRLTEDEFNAKVQQSQNVSLVKVFVTPKDEVFYFEIRKKYDCNGNVVAEIERDITIILRDMGVRQSCKKRLVIYLSNEG